MIPTTPQRLQQRLLQMSFDAFAALVALYLPTLGYQDIHLAGRRDFKGRNGRDGATGYDLIATNREGRIALVQLKQFSPKRLLYQRSIDELRGVTLRKGAAEGLLLTTGGFSRTVPRSALRRTPIAPVTTMDGEELANALLACHLGVSQNGALDERFFEQLQAGARGNGPNDCTGPTFEVTIQVQRRTRASTRS